MNNLLQKINRLQTRYDHAVKQVEAEQVALESAEQRIKDALAAQELLQTVATEVQASTHRQIASVVTRCLKAVFGESSYEFKIDFEKKRGKTDARLLLVRDGLEVDPLDAAGGGVCDVLSLSLRLAVLMLLRPAPRRLLVLDEPARMLSANYIPALRELFLSLAEEMGFQLIIVTHRASLSCGKTIVIGEETNGT